MIHDRERQHYNPPFPQSLRQEEFNYLVLVLLPGKQAVKGILFLKEMICAEPGAYTMQLYSATSGCNSVHVNTPIDSSNQVKASFLLCQLEALKKASCSIPLIWPLLVLLGLVGTDTAFQTKAATGISQWMLLCICLSIDMSLHLTNITLSLVLLDCIPTVISTSTFFHANLLNWQLTPDFLW